MRTLVRGGRVVGSDGEFSGDVLIEGQTIAQVGTAIEASVDRVVDASGCVVMPGLIDNHTHLSMPTSGTVTCDDFETGTAAAVAGGTTCIVDFAMQTDGSLLKGLEAWHAKAEGRAHIDYGFHLAVTDANERAIAEMQDAVDAGVSTFKVFMAFKGAFMVDDDQMLRVLRRTGETGGMLLVHAENGDAIDVLQRDALAAGNVAPRYHALTRPADTEAEATSRAIRLARWAERPLFVVHVSCAEAVGEVQRARDRGEPIFAETCVQYLLLTDEELSRPGYDGAAFICSPPLRRRADQGVLWAALGSGGLQGCSSDHCPFTLEQKRLGIDDFTKTPNGMPTIEHRLSLMYEHGVRTGRLSLPDLVEVTSTGPARIFGLESKGRIAPGMDADLVIFDPERELHIAAATHYMASDYDPFEGWRCRGAVRTVLARGETVVEDGKVVSTPGRGRYVPRTAFPPGPVVSPAEGVGDLP